ncbi:MAG: hypothetical protein R2911_10920 [Caldilineaceae bacterium]
MGLAPAWGRAWSSQGAAYCYIGSSGWIGVSSAAPIVDAAQRIITFHHARQRLCPHGRDAGTAGGADWAWRLLADHDVDGCGRRGPSPRRQRPALSALSAG